MTVLEITENTQLMIFGYERQWLKVPVSKEFLPNFDNCIKQDKMLTDLYIK
jgi:hypothetical protein